MAPHYWDRYEVLYYQPTDAVRTSDLADYFYCVRHCQNLPGTRFIFIDVCQIVVLPLYLTTISSFRSDLRVKVGYSRSIHYTVLSLTSNYLNWYQYLLINFQDNFQCNTIEHLINRVPWNFYHTHPVLSTSDINHWSLHWCGLVKSPTPGWV